MTQLDEFGLIRALTDGRQPESLLRANGVVVGIGDDAAVTAPTPGRHLVMSCDTMVQDVHFAATTMTFADVGFKAMAASVSDIAAMGGLPRHALVALSIPRSLGQAKVRELYDGLYACADACGVAVVGGDTTSSPHSLVVSVTVTGEAEPGRALLRSGAKPGDAVFVTGWPGCSAAGLDYLLARGAEAVQGEAQPPRLAALVQAHRRPLPRIAAGRLLLESGVCRSLNDVSDGIASEAWEIAEASQCGLLLEGSRLPVHPDLQAYAAETGLDAREWILYGGEDYELIGTLPAEAAERIEAAMQTIKLPFTVIGFVSDAFAGVRLLDESGKQSSLAKKGYNHFSQD